MTDRYVQCTYTVRVNSILISFEKHLELGPTYAAELLGVSYFTYAQYRSCRRELPLYHERHIEALRMMPFNTLSHLIGNHVRSKKAGK